MFRQSVSAHHQIAQCLRDYDKDVFDPLTVNYQSITDYVVKYLPISVQQPEFRLPLRQKVSSGPPRSGCLCSLCPHKFTGRTNPADCRESSEDGKKTSLPLPPTLTSPTTSGTVFCPTRRTKGTYNLPYSPSLFNLITLITYLFSLILIPFACLCAGRCSPLTLNGVLAYQHLKHFIRLIKDFNILVLRATVRHSCN
jgi:hypothetical protein